MTPIAAMVLEMISRGVDPEVIALAVSSAEQALMQVCIPRNSAEIALEKKREKDRLRKRNSAESEGIPRNSAEPSLSKSISLEKREAEEEEFRGGWKPCETDWNDAIAKLGERGADSELVKFRERSRKRPGGMLASEWRVWVQHAVDYVAKNKPAVAAPSPPSDPALVWDQACVTFQKFKRWPRNIGPDPDSPACRCPREVMERYGIDYARESTA